MNDKHESKDKQNQTPQKDKQNQTPQKDAGATPTPVKATAQVDKKKSDEERGTHSSQKPAAPEQRRPETPGDKG